MSPTKLGPCFQGTIHFLTINYCKRCSINFRCIFLYENWSHGRIFSKLISSSQPTNRKSLEKDIIAQCPSNLAILLVPFLGCLFVTRNQRLLVTSNLGIKMLKDIISTSARWNRQGLAFTERQPVLAERCIDDWLSLAWFYLYNYCIYYIPYSLYIHHIRSYTIYM